MSKPSIPKGTRDFGPAEMLRRNYIFDTIKSVFRKYGYLQIETPAQELLSTLMGKYGDEGDRLLFRILNSGNYLANIGGEVLAECDLSKITKEISEKGLRYDLTVPFARYVVQHRNDITFPFKRFQIQPVWRADRPQKGRYREFYQCDADAVGTHSLLMEVELVEMAADVFEKLGIAVCFHINNRKILAGIAEVMGAGDRLTDLTIAMDKLDKVGQKGVLKELEEKGFSQELIERFLPFLGLCAGDNFALLEQMERFLASSETGLLGVKELRSILSQLPLSDLQMQVCFDPSLARGLGYYTGTIMEVKSRDVQIGSISGGGRYDNLTGIFGMEGISGVGISFGADRIYDVLEQLKLFPSSLSTTAELLFVNFGEEEVAALQTLVRRLRRNGRSVVLYPDTAKVKKQFAYADALGIPFVVVAGSEELAKGEVTLKDMASGEQQTISQEALLGRFPRRI